MGSGGGIGGCLVGGATTRDRPDGQMRAVWQKLGNAERGFTGRGAKGEVVELRGFEPLTSSMPLTRSPN